MYMYDRQAHSNKWRPNDKKTKDHLCKFINRSITLKHEARERLKVQNCISYCILSSEKLPRCGVDTEEYSRSHFSSNIKWPPDATTATNNWRHLRPVRPGNPVLGTKMQLFSRTNYNLAVYADGAVRGTRDDSDLHTHLELITAGHTGHLRIQGILTKLYVAMDKKGRLYGESNMFEENTIFIEAFRGAYSTYLSRAFAHLGWYLAIKRSGKCKPGKQTSYLQKAAHFLPRRSKFER